MEGGAAVDARTFQTEALKIEKLLYHISYAMLRNESDCEDAVQEALLRAWQKRGTLRDMAAFRSWLCRIVANTCTELLRRKQRTTLTDIPEEMPAPQSDAIAHACAAEGMAYAAIPIGHSGFSHPQLDALDTLLGDATGPVLAYCRSGTRSTHLWALARARAGDDVGAMVQAAAKAGYDLSGLRPMLDALAGEK